MKLERLKSRVGALVPKITNTISRELRTVYDSNRWRNEIRPAKLVADPACQRCKYLGKRTAAEHVDHRVPLRQGGAPFDWDNLVSMCTACHSIKTMCEQRAEPFDEVAPSAPRPILRASPLGQGGFR